MVNDNIFLSSGYLNFDYIASLGATFNIIVGGRGTGKTFSSLKFMIENHRRFIFMRKNQVQLDMVSKKGFTPFEPLINELNLPIETAPMGGKVTRVTVGNDDIGYMIALSAISSIRGFDASLVQDIIYDEFIHELHEKPMRAEFEALANAYETINRNRELKGFPPVKLYLLANSNSLDSDILLGFKIIETLRRMRRKQKTIFLDQKRSLLVIDLWASPISQAKKDTALYKLTKGSEFYDMALENDFSHDRTDKIKSMPLIEYKIDIEVGELCFYKHKSKREYYITKTRMGTPKEVINPSGEGRKRLIRKYDRYYKAFINDAVKFENMTCKILFQRYYDG